MNIANRLTVFRIFLIPLFVCLLSIPLDWGQLNLLGSSISNHFFLAGLIFAIASFTDYLDGYLARKLNLVTSFGIFADPMADKLLVIAAMILLVEHQYIPAWMVIIIVSRELLVTGLRVLLAQSNGKVMAAAWPGKIKTFSQMFAILFYLWNNLGFAWLPFSLANVLMWIALFFTIYSGVEYFYQARHLFTDFK
ncbi:CDP-diacylglycerol--glycerol-3-phosphate 3-phosphatidyltransferase [Facklamia miroungae]|uniref:CDP-diacylglycerol--glycerol-3-phosphate 3-phosphatidyltransferase n=1 Tax=Facklamia miroungae TaxID=120956 RepID=A0A1G7PNC8_9LACT|nr:CDP-diacylglycerol--glycerol-3-phosphate 3-phosphatidyltransferase [Facklamia miroungae]NKZ28777.1 CDP-diacylglycerol--glycerol-3-phosphate 3-phosphatidyltransferase [Facklamia miroungae]SDF87932.1 CDP-diacylglycerol--glycerol-3-phosphate 3-phosphatidyltransferase [Facklamia miroungae]